MLNNTNQCSCTEKHHHVCAEIVPIFNHLDQDSLVKISSITKHLKYQKGDIIFSPYEKPALFVIAKGLIKEYRLSASGQEQLLRVLEPGNILGEDALLETGPPDSFAEALTDIEVCQINGDDFRSLLLEYPLISLKLLEEYNRRLRESDGLVMRITTTNAAARIASYLLDLSKAENSSSIVIPLSLKELAKFLAITPETLSRRLRLFEDDGYIVRKGKHVEIINQQSFKKYWVMLQSD